MLSCLLNDEVGRRIVAKGIAFFCVPLLEVNCSDGWERNSRFDAPFDCLWWTWETQRLLATHVICSVENRRITMREFARRLFEAEELSIDEKQNYNWYFNREEFSHIEFSFRTPASSSSTTFRVERPPEHKHDALTLVAHFARNMETLKISYDSVCDNWVLPIIADAGHWTLSLVNLEVVCGNSGMYEDVSFLGGERKPGSYPKLKSYPKRLQHITVRSKNHHVRYSPRTVNAFLKQLPCLQTISVLRSQFDRPLQSLPGVARSLRVLKLLPDDYHCTDLGYVPWKQDEATKTISEFKRLRQLDASECSFLERDRGEPFLLFMLTMLPETSITSLLIGKAELSEKGVEALCTYFSIPDSLLRELTFKRGLDHAMKTTLLESLSSSLSGGFNASIKLTRASCCNGTNMEDFQLQLNSLLSLKASWNECRAVCNSPATGVFFPALLPFILASITRRLSKSAECNQVAGTTLFHLLREYSGLIANRPRRL